MPCLKLQTRQIFCLQSAWPSDCGPSILTLYEGLEWGCSFIWSLWAPGMSGLNWLLIAGGQVLLPELVGPLLHYEQRAWLGLGGGTDGVRLQNLAIMLDTDIHCFNWKLVNWTLMIARFRFCSLWFRQVKLSHVRPMFGWIPAMSPSTCSIWLPMIAIRWATSTMHARCEWGRILWVGSGGMARHLKLQWRPMIPFFLGWKGFAGHKTTTRQLGWKWYCM